MALPVNEGQNRLRRRTAAGDLLPPLDLLITRSFLVAAAIRLPRLSLVTGVQSMVAPWTVIKSISPARPLPS